MTRRISPVAVCCSSASVRALVISAYDGAGGPLRVAVRGVPHAPQKFCLLGFSCWHRGQCIRSGSRFRVVSGQPGTASRHPGRRRSSASRPFRGARAPRPYPDPASGARWAVLGRGSPWSRGGTPSAAPTSQNSRLRHAPDGYTPSWRPESARLSPTGTGRGGSGRTARRPLPGGGPAGSGGSPAAPASAKSPGTRTRAAGRRPRPAVLAAARRRGERGHEPAHRLGLGLRAEDPDETGQVPQGWAIHMPGDLRPGRIFGDMPVPNSTELHHTQANIDQAASQEIRTLRSSECVGVRFRDHLLISRLKVRFLHGSPFDRGAATPPDSSFRSISCSPFQSRYQSVARQWADSDCSDQRSGPALPRPAPRAYSTWEGILPVGAGPQSASSSVLASRRSGVSKPSVNLP